MDDVSKETFRETLELNGQVYDYFSLKKASEIFGDLTKFPFSLKVILENLLRNFDGKVVTKDHIEALIGYNQSNDKDLDLSYVPARILMQDFTGVPAVVDLAAMRQAVTSFGVDVSKINPLSPVDLVIDHSVSVDKFGSKNAFAENVKIEFSRNKERYSFLKWGQKAFDNFRVVPPGTGICHQVNLENLAKVIWTKKVNGRLIAYPDTLVGTDSHTTMVNGLAVLGWGVGGIEAESVMLGQPISMRIPEVIGFKLEGSLPDGVTATDLVLTITETLRKKGVVGKFVEFFGPGLNDLAIADRATIANMAPEYGATCGFFPIDRETCKYLKFTGREFNLVEAYAKTQGMWRDKNTNDPIFTDSLALNMDEIKPSMAGPKRPQDRVELNKVKEETLKFIDKDIEFKLLEQDYMDETKELNNGDVVIAAITSCTNTSNPSVMVAAGLLAKKAIDLGLKRKPWVKTSLAPGSQVVSDYLNAAGLIEPLEKLGFHIVGYGCTTCIGNSGPLEELIKDQIENKNLSVSAVLSGNRNFEGRINPLVKANWLASPPLVVAYAILGTLVKDITSDPLGLDKQNKKIFLSDIWPSSAEIKKVLNKCLSEDMFKERYKNVFLGPKEWSDIEAEKGLTYNWDIGSTYIRCPTYFNDMSLDIEPLKDIVNAKCLAFLGDSITTDHISPAGAIKNDGPAAKYLMDHQVSEINFNSFGSRRGNHEVMMRGTFGNIRLRNKMVPNKEGGLTKHRPNSDVLSIYEAAMQYKEENIPLMILAGKEYGTGSSRDWAAKGTALLGVRFVLAESFERIHRSNLIGMGILPVEFMDNYSADKLKLSGFETFSIKNIIKEVTPGAILNMDINYLNGINKTIPVLCRIDTNDELDYYRNGGILHYVLRNLIRDAA
ncbi:MAG TPA: aconitate hydratase AcnA [Alphaproteobacteria bacterium]|nr:aconitate hydratase AcnA [Alphaproteobacteria bacterium]